MQENCVGQCIFLRRVRHEAINLLAPLKIHLQLLHRSTADPQARQRLEKAERLLEQLSREVRFIGQVARLRPQNLKDIFQMVSSQWKCENQEREISLLERYERVSASCLVLTQPEQLLTLLINLVRNAARFSGPEGRITIKFSQEGPRVRVSVCDQGPGFATDGGLFEHKDAACCADDHGHGLAICQQIAEAHGSDLRYQNLAGGGCEVYFHLQRYYLGDPKHEVTFEASYRGSLALAVAAGA